MAFSAGGATYYVDFVGGSDANAGTTTGAPFKRCPGDAAATGTAASTTPVAGDIIAFKGGVIYTIGGSDLLIKSSGNSGSRITYDGNLSGWGDGTKAKITGGRVEMNQKDYIDWQNFEHYNGAEIHGRGHATTSQDFWRIRTNYFHDTLTHAVTFHGDVNDSEITDSVFEYNNYVRGADDTHDGATGQNDVLTDSTKSWTVNAYVGMQLYNRTGNGTGVITANTATTISATMRNEANSADVNWTTGASYAIVPEDSDRGAIYVNGNRDSDGGVTTGNVFRIKVLRNTFYKTGDTPILFFHCDDVEIGWNSITGPNAKFHSNGITFYQSQGDGNEGDLWVHHNYYSGNRVFFAAQDNAPVNPWLFENNIINQSGSVSTCILWDDFGGGDTGTIRVINNVLWGANNFCVQQLHAGVTTIIRNNIVSKPYSVSGSVTASDNTYTHTTTPTGESGAFFITNLATIFTDTTLDSADDFQILETFSGVDTGFDVSIYSVTDDYEGTSRPQGAAYDMGAYEYAAAPATINRSVRGIVNLRGSATVR